MSEIRLKKILLYCQLLVILSCLPTFNFSNAIAASPQDTPDKIAFKKGIFLGEQGRYEEAILAFTEAIKINPHYSKAYYNRGYAYSLKQQYNQAIADYSKAISLKPKYQRAYYERARAFYELKDYDKSWVDVHSLESLRINIDPVFIKKLQEASQRQS